MSKITLVQAGAGSGKTTRICKEIADRASQGLAPERVLATTFTKKAAADLKAKLQERLLKDERLPMRDRVEKARALDRALIGTVDSVGYRLLQRYALKLGISPDLETVEEEAQERHLRELLAQVDPKRRAGLAEVARRMGQDEFDHLALRLLAAKRANLIPGGEFAAQLTRSGDDLLRRMASGGPVGGLPEFDGLYHAGREALRRLDALAKPTKGTEKLKADLRERVRAGRGVWGDWAWFAGLESTSKDKANEAIADLITLAGRVWDHRDLHEDVKQFLAKLAEYVIELDRSYAGYKRERGLVDFTDLEEMFLKMMDDPEIRKDVEASVDLVVVDEFQDTNPIQLAIFQRLAEIAKESIWVGDEKQAIYGFRGADAQLMQDVISTIPEGQRDRLPKCYRSGEGLVKLVGAVFSRVKQFGNSAVLKHEHERQSFVERWSLEGDNRAEHAAALATGISALVAEGVRLGEVAVLVRKNDDAKLAGDALRAAGLSVVVEVPGLLRTREGASALAGLQLVADRGDSLAAATLLHLLKEHGEGTPAWLSERLASVEAGEGGVPWGGDELLTNLEGIPSESTSPTGVLAAVVEALRVPDKAAEWGDPAKRSANLDALLALAMRYEEEARQEDRAATLTGLVAFLQDLEEDEEDFFPVPVGIEAVTVMTLHGAKGLEWPTVVFACLTGEREADPWEPQASGGKAREGKPLEGREVRFWPWPFGYNRYRNQVTGRARDGTKATDILLSSKEGATLVAAQLGELERLLYVGFTRSKDRLVIAHNKAGLKLLAPLEALDEFLKPEGGEDTLTGKKIPASYRHRALAPPDVVPPPPAEQKWIAYLVRASVENQRYHPPSRAPVLENTEAEIAMFDGGIAMAKQPPEVAEAVGEAVHAYHSSLPSTRELGQEKRLEVARRCLRLWGVESVLTPEGLVDAGERFERWAEAAYPGAEWHVEVPVTAPRPEGGQWNGTVDLVLLLPGRKAAVVDHKGVIVPEEEVVAKAKDYSGQLGAYRQVLEANGVQVVAAFVHFPLAGAVVRLGDN